MRTKNQETLDRILKFVNKYYQEHHSSPTINDVAEGVGVARLRTPLCKISSTGEIEQRFRLN